MRVYHLSSAPFAGGAARAGFRLHEGLLRETGVESIWLDAEGSAHGPSVTKLSQPLKRSPLLLRIRRKKWAKITREHFGPTTPPASNPIGWGNIDILEKLPKPDVWNLHWVSWFLDWENLLPWMAEQAPIVWTLHDLNPLRGIWHYEPLPEERTPLRMRYEAEAIELKKRALAKIPKDRITFVGPSKWMVEECRKSPVTTGFRVEHIPYGLDTEIFKSRPKTQIREIFGISESDYVVGFVGYNVNDPRKGIGVLLDTLSNLGKNTSGIHLLIIGAGKIKDIPVSHTCLGGINNETLMSYMYSACDLFWCPSLQDNLPNTVLESISCGTPVLAFNIGGMPDMIIDEVNGFLVSYLEGAAVKNMKEKLEYIVRKYHNKEKQKQNDHFPPDKFTLNFQAQSYLRLYSQSRSKDYVA